MTVLKRPWDLEKPFMIFKMKKMNKKRKKLLGIFTKNSSLILWENTNNLQMLVKISKMFKKIKFLLLLIKTYFLWKNIWSKNLRIWRLFYRIFNPIVSLDWISTTFCNFRKMNLSFYKFLRKEILNLGENKL